MPKPEAEFSPLAMQRSMRALRQDVREAVVHDFAARRADDVADEENFHLCLILSAARTANRKFRWSGPLRRALLGPEPHE